MSVITGLLLHRSKAHRSNPRTSCVGQIRLDSLGSSLEIGTSHTLWLQFSPTKMGGYCVTVAATSPPSDIHAPNWLALPCSGLLEWWFSFRQCRVHHKDQVSPETTMIPAGQYRRLLEQQGHRLWGSGSTLRHCLPRIGLSNEPKPPCIIGADREVRFDVCGIWYRGYGG
ncbi:hypothetical protein VTK56DRAFT_2075 [Thermocarpiscus australiensis]